MVLTRPWLALMLAVSVELSNLSEVVVLHGLPGVTSFTLVLALGTIVVGLRRGTVRLVWSPVFFFAVVFLAARSFSLPMSLEPAEGVSTIGDAAKSLALLVLATTLVSSTRRFQPLVMGAVAVLAGAAAITVINQYVLHNASNLGGLSNVPLTEELGAATARHAGPESDVNSWARNLVLYVPCALSLWAAGRKKRGWAWALAAATLAWGVYLTQSRGGMIALATGVLTWLVLVRPFSLRTLLVAPALVGGLLFVAPGFASRLATLSSLGEAQSGAGDTSLVGRLAVQEAGWNMFRDHAATGVGPGNFSEALPDYEQQTGLAGPKILAPHNLYLQMGAEGGAIGLTGWLLFFGAGLFVTTRARLSSGNTTSTRLPAGAFLLSNGVLAGMVAWGVASAFLQLGDFAVLLTVMAVGAGLDIQVREGLRRGGREPSGIDSQRNGSVAVATRPGHNTGSPSGRAFLRPRRRQTRRWSIAAMVFLLTVSVGLLVVPVHRSLWLATASAVLAPVSTGSSPADAYEYDILSRRPLLGTYQVIVDNPRFRREAENRLGLTDSDVRDLDFSVGTSTTSAVLTLQVRGPDRSVTARMTTAALEQARQYLESVQDDYTLRPTASAPPTVQQVEVLESRRVLMVMGVSLALAWLVMQARRRWQRRPGAISPKVSLPPSARENVSHGERFSSGI